MSIAAFSIVVSGCAVDEIPLGEESVDEPATTGTWIDSLTPTQAEALLAFMVDTFDGVVISESTVEEIDERNEALEDELEVVLTADQLELFLSDQVVADERSGADAKSISTNCDLWSTNASKAVTWSSWAETANTSTNADGKADLEKGAEYADYGRLCAPTTTFPHGSCGWYGPLWSYASIGKLVSADPNISTTPNASATVLGYSAHCYDYGARVYGYAAVIYGSACVNEP